jgi:hypothetical protein
MKLSVQTLLAPFFALIILVTMSCKGEDNKKLTCVKINETPEMEKITWEQVGAVEALFDVKSDKEIMGKAFGEQHYCTLTARIKNTSCFTSNFTVKFQLVTFSEKDIYDTKVKEIKPGEEVEIKSLPFEVKNLDDVSDKSIAEVKTDYIRKKVKVTYEKDCLPSEKNCRCDALNDDTYTSKMLTIKSEDALKCEEDVKAVVVGQIGGSPKNTEGSKAAKKK